MSRTHGPETLITIYSEETRPGCYRYMYMCPIRLHALLDPASILGEATKRRAIRLLNKAAAYHLERATRPERVGELTELINKMKKYANATATANTN
jgi:hypothetical protein